MKKIFLAVVLALGIPAFAQETASISETGSATPTPFPVIPGKWNASKTPWDLWFKKNTQVTDKQDYVHFFWNAQDCKANFETQDKKRRLADAALQLVVRFYPTGAKADLMKVDIVYVLERDSYGMPKWDSLQQVAHLECSRAKALKLSKKKSILSEAALAKIFDKFEVF